MTLSPCFILFFRHVASFFKVDSRNKMQNWRDHLACTVFFLKFHFLKPPPPPTPPGPPLISACFLFALFVMEDIFFLSKTNVIFIHAFMKSYFIFSYYICSHSYQTLEKKCSFAIIVIATCPVQ